MLKIFASPSFLLFGVILAFTSVPSLSTSDSLAEETNGITSPIQNLRTFFAEYLPPGKIVVKKLKGGERHFYTVKAEAGNCLRFIVEQKGIDAEIIIRDLNDKVIKAVDRPSGSFGRETATFIAPKDGTFKVEIKTWLKTAPVGVYQISYTLIETPTEKDTQRDIAENLVSQAEVLRNTSKKENRLDALQKFDEALKIWQYLDDEYEQAVIFYGLGQTHQSLSNYSEAAIFYNKAIILMNKLDDEPSAALNHAALGSVQYILGEYDFAVYNYKRAIHIYKKFQSARGIGIALAGLGTVESLLEKDTEALKSLKESLRWRGLANDKKGKIRTLITLSKVYLQLKLQREAKLNLDIAKNLLNEAGEDREAEAELLLYYGRLHILTGEAEEAHENLGTALALARQTGSKLGEANILLELSRTQSHLSQFEKSLESILSAINLIEQLRNETADFRVRMNFSETVQPFYEHYVLLLMKMHNHSPNKGFDRQALQISEQSRARRLLDQLERRQLIRQNKIPSQLLERSQKLRDKLTEILVPQTKINSNVLTAQIQKIQAEYAEAEAEINKLLKTTETVTLPVTSTKNIQKNLADDTVLLEYELLENESFLWLVTKNELKSYRLPPSKQIEQISQEIYSCISQPLKPDREKTCHQKLEKLSDILLKPVVNEIQNKRLVIVKNGALHYIPFTTLLNPKTRHYLVETNEIVTLPSASVLVFLRQMEKRSPDKALAIFADPIFSNSDSRVSVKDKLKNDVEINTNLPRLFASKFEAERIAAFVAPENLLLKTGADATRQAVFDSDLGRYRNLHFATHALINDSQPELSSIALSFFDKDGKELYGFLHWNDILRLDLNADLVVLSACRSGFGKQIKGEGLVSLAHSFFSAGAESLIVSLWDVDDKVTAEFITRFYRKNLKENKPAAKALRETQVEIMQDRRWRSPFYWSAFILQGDWE